MLIIHDLAECSSSPTLPSPKSPTRQTLLLLPAQLSGVNAPSDTALMSAIISPCSLHSSLAIKAAPKAECEC